MLWPGAMKGKQFMIPMAHSTQETSSSPRLFTLSLEEQHEEILNHAMLAKKVGRNFARRRGRKFDRFFIDEMETEALFWLVILYTEKYEELQRHDNLEAFLRQKIGYKLKEYIFRVACSTFSYLKKKGKHIPNEVDFVELGKQDTDIPCFECLQSVLYTEVEWDIYELHIRGNEPEFIAAKLGKSAVRIRKVLSKIKKRLKAYNRRYD